ncbi:hypothetical protein EDC04DRAFT_2576000 [Pisolithus marmoratus]|nr:hypothetical protein EDC04DRAFT_2576000 [Pisolithus marmoratus]
MGNRLLDYLFGVTLGATILQSVRILLLVRPLEEYRHELDKVPAYQLSLVQRFLWLLKMTYSPRGVGWSFKAENSVVPVDMHHRTRTSFIASRLRWFLSHYLLLEVATICANCIPVLLSAASRTSQGYIVLCLNVTLAYCQSYATITCIHCVLAVVVVGANLDEPQAWPQPFGHFKDACTIRKFWGYTWQQFFRHVVHSEHSSVSKPKEREPWATRYRRLCYAFMCSAFVHLCGDIVLQCPNMIGYSVPYFLLQPVGVLVEDAVMEVGKRVGVKEGIWTRMIGYAWVLVFTGFSYPLMLDGLTKAFQVEQWVGEGAGAKATLIEVIADRVFSMQLASVISSWLSRV